MVPPEGRGPTTGPAGTYASPPTGSRISIARSIGGTPGSSVNRGVSCCPDVDRTPRDPRRPRRRSSSPIRRYAARVADATDAAARSARRSPGRSPCGRSSWPARRGPAAPVLAVTATTREAEELAPSARRPGRRRDDRLLPELGDAAARAAQPAQRHRRPPARRAAAAVPPRHRRRHRPAAGGRGTGALGAPAAGEGTRRPRAGRARGRRHDADSTTSCAGSSDAAYTRVDLVERRGEFAVRGGIVDVFPPTEEHPLRVEFWGDDVEEIRSFAVADQRTIEKAERLWAPPCRELLLTDDGAAPGGRAGREQHPSCASSPTSSRPGIAVEGMESLAPALVDEMELLVDLLPDDTHVLVLDPERARARAHDLVATSEEFLAASWASAAGGGKAPIDLGAASYRELADVREPRPRPPRPRAWWTLSPFGLDDDGATDRRAGSSVRARTDLPRRRRDGVRRHRAVARRRLPGGGPAPGPRAGTADGRGAGGARRAGAARRRAGTVEADVVTVTCGLAQPPASSTTTTGWSCSPARTSSARRAPPATCGGCRPAARSRSTRSS